MDGVTEQMWAQLGGRVPKGSTTDRWRDGAEWEQLKGGRGTQGSFTGLGWEGVSLTATTTKGSSLYCTTTTIMHAPINQLSNSQYLKMG